MSSKKFYQTKIVDDSITLIQYECSPLGEHLLIHFGPLSATVRELFDNGFYFTVTFTNRDRINYKRVGLYLRRSIKTGGIHSCDERFKISNVVPSAYLESDDLIKFIRFNNQVIKKFSYGNKPITDPYEELLLKHPKKQKIPMIGNQTLKEYIRDILKKIIIT